MKTAHDISTGNQIRRRQYFLHCMTRLHPIEVLRRTRSQKESAEGMLNHARRRLNATVTDTFRLKHSQDSHCGLSYDSSVTCGNTHEQYHVMSRRCRGASGQHPYHACVLSVMRFKEASGRIRRNKRCCSERHEFLCLN